MVNCKKEFLKEIRGEIILCAKIETFRESPPGDQRILYDNFTPLLYDKFVKSLDFEYGSGFGRQELYGFIWYKDGSWSERMEYDGSEWWEHKICPEKP
jgi:hypothetical protein